MANAASGDPVQSYVCPLPRNAPPSLERAKTILTSLLGKFQTKNHEWQAHAIVVLADGSRDHFLSYVYKQGGSFRDGIRVEQVGVAIYENVGKIAEKPEGMDRELCRDYVLKPLIELGVVVKATWKNGNPPLLLPGHLKAKSPNSVYRLADKMIEVLDCPDSDFGAQLEELKFTLPQVQQERLAIEQLVANTQCDQSHGRLVKACADIVKEYGADSTLVFLDLADGQRISDEYEKLLKEHGLALTLADNVPDAILASKKSQKVIAIEGVISDGEFDEHRFDQLHKWAKEHKHEVAAAITAYPDYESFARRQSKYNNLANGSYVWIMSHPQCLFRKNQISVELGNIGLLKQ